MTWGSGVVLEIRVDLDREETQPLGKAIPSRQSSFRGLKRLGVEGKEQQQLLVLHWARPRRGPGGLRSPWNTKGRVGSFTTLFGWPGSGAGDFPEALP